MKLSEKIFNAWNTGEEIGTPPELAREAAALENRVAKLEAALRAIGDEARKVLIETPPGEDPMMLAPWVAGTAFDALRG